MHSTLFRDAFGVFQHHGELNRSPSLILFSQGSFHVTAVQPVSYTIEEVSGLLSLDNTVCCFVLPLRFERHTCSHAKLLLWHFQCAASVALHDCAKLALLSCFCPFLQALLRGVVPGSFPSQLAAEPSYEVGQRRFIVMDDNVHAVYGERVEQVRMAMLFVLFLFMLRHDNAIIVSSRVALMKVPFAGATAMLRAPAHWMTGTNCLRPAVLHAPRF